MKDWGDRDSVYIYIYILRKRGMKTHENDYVAWVTKSIYWMDILIHQLGPFSSYINVKSMLAPSSSSCL